MVISLSYILKLEVWFDTNILQGDMSSGELNKKAQNNDLNNAICSLWLSKYFHISKHIKVSRYI